MKKRIFFLFIYFNLAGILFGQQSGFNHSYFVTDKNSANIFMRYETGDQTSRIIQDSKFLKVPFSSYSQNSRIRWYYQDFTGIGYQCNSDESGSYHVNGWFLNNLRISLYGNQDSTALWEVPVSQHFDYNYVSISKNGLKVAAGAINHIYIFNRSSPAPIFNFDVTTIQQNHVANNVALTSSGEFLVCASVPQNGIIDSSMIYGFNTGSAVPVWQRKLYTNTQMNSIFGIKLSGNDSLFIVSTLYEFFVVKTYTGEVVFSGKVGPNNNSNSQEKQGINGDGSVISTNSHDGYLTVYKFIGSSYTLLWRYKDTNPDLISQWITVSDVTNDGKYLACGTLDWRWNGGYLYDGEVKYFEIENGPVPKWTYMHMGDMVKSVSFSKSGNILSACSWGDESDILSDILIFKTSLNTNVPIFSYSSPGSMFDCYTSDNGSSVLVTGKGVHARNFGNGGYFYNIFVDSNDTPIGIINTGLNIPDEFFLSQNYPNPFNPVTKIKFQLPKSGFTKLTIFDVTGKVIQQMINKDLLSGTYEVDFDGSNLPSGVYYYKLENNSFSETKKMVLIK